MCMGYVRTRAQRILFDVRVMFFLVHPPAVFSSSWVSQATLSARSVDLLACPDLDAQRAFAEATAQVPLLQQVGAWVLVTVLLYG